MGRAAYDAAGFTTSTVVEGIGAGHGVLYWDENIMRGVFADFMNTPTTDASTWNSVSGCSLEGGVYRCALADTQQYCNLTTYEPADGGAQFANPGTPPNATACSTGMESNRGLLRSVSEG